MNVYQTVADKGNRKASYKVAQLMSKNAKEKQQAYKALSYAYKALDRVRKSKNKTEEGWPVYKRTSAEQIVKIVTDFKLVPRDKKEYESLERDYATPDGMKRFTVPIDCGAQKNFPYEVYVWNWRKEYSPVEPQAEWVEKVRGCKFPKDSRDKFNESAKIASKDFLPLAEVTAFQLGDKDTKAKAREKLSKIIKKRSAAEFNKRVKPEFYFKVLTNLKNYPAFAECKKQNRKLKYFDFPIDKTIETISDFYRKAKKLIDDPKKFAKMNMKKTYELYGVKAVKILGALDKCARGGNPKIYYELQALSASVGTLNRGIIKAELKAIEKFLGKK
jgi:hypothetical protein